MRPRVPLRHGQRVLTVVWFGAAALLFPLLFVQTISGRYGGDAGRAWSWLLPNLVPTLSLIVGVLIASATSNHERALAVDRFVYRLCVFLSLFYVGAVFTTVLAVPFAEWEGMAALDLMELSQIWLAPLQGLVTASLGVFFLDSRSD